MFTGIVEAIGKVKSFEKQRLSGRITVEVGLNLGDLGIGASIAVDGVCLTIIGFSGADKSAFSADISKETLRLTTLGSFKSGSSVNIERPLTLSKPLSGHLVTGHIDGVGVISRRHETSHGTGLKISIERPLLKWFVKKGSVAIDGISLTVADLDDEDFTVILVPHTLKVTTLGAKKEGSRVNIETDIIGKYVQRLLNVDGQKGPITEGFLREHGFIK
ncbi:MAG: riboflavin synthase [Deltaproteobacteria bacterium]|nr:riboflavin synthase [Deltaproteobacteria bacterium]